jgi:thiamine biosynthesis lipoprotein
MRAWGFRGPSEGDRGGPSRGMAAVELDRTAGTVRFLDRTVELDLGAIAKGVALDRAGETLRESGVTCALLHGGTSSVIGIGTPPDTGGWPIALDREGQLPRVSLRDAALAVSAGRGRLVAEESSAPWAHILDPGEGEPASPGAWSAVVTDSAAVADAWATALVAAGERELEPPRGLSFVVGKSALSVTGSSDPSGIFS